MWNHLFFDEGGFTDFEFEYSLSTEDYSKISCGYAPDDISSRYLAYFEDETLFIHSIMGGACYVEVHVDSNGNNKKICRLRKYDKYNPHHDKLGTIEFVKSFLKYSIGMK